jgi:hypothetical protein
MGIFNTIMQTIGIFGILYIFADLTIWILSILADMIIWVLTAGIKHD